MSSEEPGLDRHEWESERALLDEDLHTDPAAALPEFADLVERMLGERGYQLDEPVTEEGDEREIVDEYRSAREIADRVERGDDVDPGDVGAAIEGLQSLYEHLLSGREAP